MTELTSARIRVARVVCIFFVIFTHMTVGAPDQRAIVTSAWQEAVLVFKLILHDGFARVSVPLLGVISGYLTTRTLARQSYGQTVVRKLRSIYLPMVLWSVAMMAAYVLLALATRDPGFLQKHLALDGLGWLNALFALTDKPFNGPLYFLRDLFLCFLILPLLLLAARRIPLLSFLGAATVFGFNDQLVALQETHGVTVFMRPAIPALFLVGLLVGSGYGARHYATFERLVGRALPLLLLMACLFALYPHIVVRMGGQSGFEAQNPFGRFFSVLFLWGLVMRLTASRWKEPLGRLSEAMFFVFCAHKIVLFLSTHVLGALFGWTFSPVVSSLAYFLLPVATFVVLAATYRHFRRRLPRTSALMLGDR